MPSNHAAEMIELAWIEVKYAEADAAELLTLTTRPSDLAELRSLRATLAMAATNLTLVSACLQSVVFLDGAQRDGVREAAPGFDQDAIAKSRALTPTRWDIVPEPPAAADLARPARMSSIKPGPR